MSDVDPIKGGTDVIRPGHINLQLQRGSASGCAVIEFVDEMSLVDGVNRITNSAGTQFMQWSAENTNRLVVDMQYSTDTASRGRILVTYTMVLTQEELDEFNEVNLIARQMMNDRKDKREAAKYAEEQGKRDAEAETARLIEVGRRCELNHPKAVGKKLKGKPDADSR